MAAPRLTYPDKTNNASDPDSIKKWHATEANLVKTTVNVHADLLDNLLNALGINEANINLGTFSNLSILNAAYPDGPENVGDYAIIHDGSSATPQIAVYNSGTTQWEITGAIDPIIWVANASALPGTGTANKLYIALDSGVIKYWDEGQYKEAGRTPPTTQPQVVQQQFTAASDGQVAYTLSKTPVGLIVILDRVLQIPIIDYTWTGATLTFTNSSAIVSGSIIDVTIF